MARAVCHVHEVAHSFYQLEPIIVFVRGDVGQNQRHLQLAVALTQQQRFTLGRVPALPDEAPHVGSLLQAVEALEQAVARIGLGRAEQQPVGQCSPPAPRTGSTPRSRSSEPSDSEPVFSQRS